MLSLTIIKIANAMQKVMVSLLKTFTLWVFFMCWQQSGHEEWSWVKALGMLLLACGTMWYIDLDIKDIEAQQIKLKRDTPPTLQELTHRGSVPVLKS